MDRAPLSEPVFVDRDMWEKIVFNLLSNAFKFTLEGEVHIQLCPEGDKALLRVRDSGTGIPGSELGNIFKRFHRVQNVRARTHEGTGIGLALVQELVKLHGGCISAESAVGSGSTFTVRIPFGKAHLPPERIGAPRQQASTAVRGEIFVEEAAHWAPRNGANRLKESAGANATAPRAHQRLPTVLVVDDNLDMRDYICRLIQGRYQLMMAADGAEALAAARRERPDLILTDIMMPRMDGFALLREIRRDAGLKELPVIFLSARAGEEARVEGIEQNADDYLVKPFSARELSARIETHLKLARLRGEAAEKERQLNRELEHRVEERTRSLREAIAQMEEFSYIVSHDLRSPIRAMLGYAKIIMDDYGEQLGGEGRKFLERIVQNAWRMDRLIRDVLTYGRVGRRGMELREVALHRLFRDVIDQYPEFAAERAKIFIEGNLPDVIAHEPSLSQVISNLLSNAVKFVPAGVMPEVLIRSERLNGEARVWIEDNGIGIKPEHQPRLFGMFERIHPEEKYEGTGVGLAIVRKAMERMGGKVGVESEGIRGSKFWIQLPAA